MLKKLSALSTKEKVYLVVSFVCILIIIYNLSNTFGWLHTNTQPVVVGTTTAPTDKKSPATEQKTDKKVLTGMNDIDIKSIKNPFMPLVPPGKTDAMGALNNTISAIASTPVLAGTIYKDQQYIAIIAINGKANYYKPGQKIDNSTYKVLSISNKSATIYDTSASKSITLRLKG